MTEFDYYIRQGEPSQRERAEAWAVAIGLQDVDGLKTSNYLRETARKHIEGDISIKDVQRLVHTYYQSKTKRTADDDDQFEADSVSSKIVELLESNTVGFTLPGYVSIHKHLFTGVYKFAGRIRDYNITKKEWGLRGGTVNYLNYMDIRPAIEYDLEKERAFSYKGLSADAIVAHIARFVAGLWQIHAFGEGNTRTTAVFTILYLRSIGFDIDNSLFAENSWYFRNALVRANYKNATNGIDYDYQFLERFFRNLLLGEHNELKNRYMLINPPKELQPSPSSTPSSTPSSLDINSTSEPIQRLVLAINEQQLSKKELMQSLGLKDRANFKDYSLTPAIQRGYVHLLYPDSPKHPRQKYLLTIKGLMIYQMLKEIEQ